jgi:Ribonuclease G/E
MRRLFVAAEQGPLRAALIDDDDRLQGAWWFADGRDSMVGDRFFGRVLKIDRGLETAFVDIGLPQPGFLPLAACPTPPSEGQAVTVEVSRDPLAGKGARLTAKIGEAVALPVGTRPPQRLTKEGPLRRLLGRLGGDLEIFADTRRAAEELSAAAATLPAGRRLRIEHRPQRDWTPKMAEIESEVAAALDPRVELPSGGWLLFEPGQTLTVVDVNSGSSQGTTGERHWLKTNLEAAKEIGRQLRLRHIGGIVVIDFIDLKAVLQRRQVSEAMRHAVSGDWEPCWVGPMSRLGLVEMTRRRNGPTLAEMWGPEMWSKESGAE